MQLLVSVSDASEARAALAGGADVIDAKDPRRGALGAVPSPVLAAIYDAVGSRRPVSAALGDSGGAPTLERAARGAAHLGVAFVKVGFRGIATATGARRLAAVVCRGVGARGGETRVV